MFRAGNTADPSTWPLAPRPNRVVVREGAGTGGSDRITVTWPEGALQNTWLQVTVKATRDTGLTEPDVFYFGDAVGDTSGSSLAGREYKYAARASESRFTVDTLAGAPAP